MELLADKSKFISLICMNGVIKAKPPLLCGNKSISDDINNQIELLDSYSFVSSAFSKFPAFFRVSFLIIHTTSQIVFILQKGKKNTV